mgnify:CR=1 FL=1
MSLVVFDLDGTLVDTRDAVVTAYAEVGIHMPTQAWGRPWQDWLPGSASLNGRSAKDVHAAKNRVYPACLARLARPTPLLTYAAVKQSSVITGASKEAVEAIQQQFNVKLNVGGYNMTLNDKIYWLNEAYQSAEDCIYIDDDESTREHVYYGTHWRPLCPHHAYRLLFLPQGPTHG